MAGRTRRYRPVGTAQKRRGGPVYGPGGTGCPVVERAIETLYKGQNEETFWALMNALNYALEMDTHVLVPLRAVHDVLQSPVHWAAHPLPQEKAEGLPLWTIESPRKNTYLPLFTSVRAAEANAYTGTLPMAELTMRDAMERAISDPNVDGVTLDPWTRSATLDEPLLNGLLHAEHTDDLPGAEELEQAERAEADGDYEKARELCDQAARKGRSEGLTRLATLLYMGLGGPKDTVTARRMWKAAADSGEISAMLSLGDDLLSRNKGEANALRFYRRAQRAARAEPDIDYMPILCLRMAQCETRYLSKSKALAQLAEARHGFSIWLREGLPDAQGWLAETDRTIAEVLRSQKASK